MQFDDLYFSIEFQKSMKWIHEMLTNKYTLGKQTKKEILYNNSH